MKYIYLTHWNMQEEGTGDPNEGADSISGSKNVPQTPIGHPRDPIGQRRARSIL